MEGRSNLALSDVLCKCIHNDLYIQSRAGEWRVLISISGSPTDSPSETGGCMACQCLGSKKMRLILVRGITSHLGTLGRVAEGRVGVEGEH